MTAIHTRDTIIKPLKDILNIEIGTNRISEAIAYLYDNNIKIEPYTKNVPDEINKKRILQKKIARK